ncbi:tRNA-splicing endonuclease subunit Sen15-like [Dysidea avara]|uniref:tRNA-splicing endonuclease subunit Sen15-like n=1 Tax=Dysidea avara TaxID=196820 RepID=UPI00331EA33A
MAGDNVQLHASLVTSLHLSEVKKWSNVELKHCSELNMTYLCARDQQQELRCVLPLSASHVISIDMLSGGLGQLCGDIKSFILAVVDDDSTIAYYNIFKDIHPPDLPNRETRNYKQ